MPVTRVCTAQPSQQGQHWFLAAALVLTNETPSPGAETPSPEAAALHTNEPEEAIHETPPEETPDETRLDETASEEGFSAEEPVVELTPITVPLVSFRVTPLAASEEAQTLYGLTPSSKEELENVDYAEVLTVSPEECAGLSQHFLSQENVAELSLERLGHLTAPLVAREATCMLYPDVDVFNPLKRLADFDHTVRDFKFAPHPLDEVTTRYRVPPWNPLQRRQDTDYKYDTFEDHYNPALSKDVAAFLLPPEERQAITDKILNPPGHYPLPIPDDFDMNAIQVPTEDEECHGVKIHLLNHPNDWRIMRSPLEDLEFT